MAVALASERPQKQLTLDSLRDAVEDVRGFLAALRQVVPVDVDDELLVYLESVPKSKVLLQDLLDRLQPRERR